MKRKTANAIGNTLMGLGLVTMVAGVGYSIISQLESLGLPDFLAHVAIMAIFSGALIWLAGARIGGRDTIADRYWWARHVCKHYRKHERHP